MTVADIVLSDAFPEAQARATLSERGFSDPARALLNLRHIGGEAERRTLFARLAILACDVLSQRPDPDMALNNWERFLHALPDPQAHLRQMLSQPMRLEILLSIFSASQFLADTLVRDPALLDYIGRSEVIRAPRPSAAIAEELRADFRGARRAASQWRDALREVPAPRDPSHRGARHLPRHRHAADHGGALRPGRRRHRGGLRDPRQADDARGTAGAASASIAFGKLGAASSTTARTSTCSGCAIRDGIRMPWKQAAGDMEALRADLSVHTVEGYAYRVDLRLRPYGSSGQLVFPLDSLVQYYGQTAALWELQALLKARPVAGDLEIGRAFLESTRGAAHAPITQAEVASSIDRLRREAVKALSRSILSTTDIKTGLGGLRDVEFLAQGLQLVHAHQQPGLLCGGTLPALKALGRSGHPAAGDR